MVRPVLAALLAAAPPPRLRRNVAVPVPERHPGQQPPRYQIPLPGQDVLGRRHLARVPAIDISETALLQERAPIRVGDGDRRHSSFWELVEDVQTVSDRQGRQFAVRSDGDRRTKTEHVMVIGEERTDRGLLQGTGRSGRFRNIRDLQGGADRSRVGTPLTRLIIGGAIKRPCPGRCWMRRPSSGTRDGSPTDGRGMRIAESSMVAWSSADWLAAMRHGRIGEVHATTKSRITRFGICRPCYDERDTKKDEICTLGQSLY